MTREELDKRIDEIFKHKYINGQGHIVAPKHIGWKFFDELYDSFEAELQAYQDKILELEDANCNLHIDNIKLSDKLSGEKDNQ